MDVQSSEDYIANSINTCEQFNSYTNKLLAEMMFLYYGDSIPIYPDMHFNVPQNLKFCRHHRTLCDDGGMVAEVNHAESHIPHPDTTL